MKNSFFELTGEYIELIKLLKLMHIAESGSHAKYLVEEGEVRVNNKTETRKRAKLRQGDVIEVSDFRLTIR
jgi:ribosome-associated protein